MSNAFGYVFQDGRNGTSSGVETEQNKDIGLVSTIMGKLTHTDGESSSYFNKTDKRAIAGTSFKQMLFTNHNNPQNKGKIKGHLNMKILKGFLKQLEK